MRTLLFLTAAVLSSSLAAAWPWDKPSLDPIIALNYAHAALARVIHDRSRVTLEREYEAIFENLNLNTIDDQVTVTILRHLSDTIHRFRMSERERDHLEVVRSRRLNIALSDALSAKTLHEALQSDNIRVAIGAVIVSTAAQIAFPPDLKESTWALDSEELDALHQIRAELLEAYWSVLHRYNIDDTNRLTEADFEELTTVFADPDPVRRERRVGKFLDRAAAYPPIAFYAAAAAEEAGDHAAAGSRYRSFVAEWRPVLRHDELYAAGLMELVRLEGSTPNEDTIETVLKHSESVPGARLFAATALANLGQNDQAEQILEVSIDRGLAPTASRRLLAAFLAGKHPWQFGELVRSVIVNERESLLESASLTALSPSPNLISTFADPMAKTELRFSRGYLNNSLEFTAPSRLLKSGDDVAQVALGLPDKSVPGELDTSTVDTVHATFPYDIPDGLQKLSVPVMVKLPTINAEFLFQGTVTAERDQSWTTSVLDAASAAAGPISQNASSLIWGKSSSPTAEHSAANDKIPTVPIWHFSLRTIKGEGFCYASVDGALAACPID